jgi:hypothetical protein
MAAFLLKADLTRTFATRRLMTQSGHYDNHGSAGPTKSKRWKIVIGARISLPINLVVLTVPNHYADAYDADSGAEPKPGQMTNVFMKMRQVASP